MNPWRWLFGAKVRVLRLRPGDVVVLEAMRPATLNQITAVKDKWAEELPDVPVAVLDGLRLGGVVRSEKAHYPDPTQVPPTPPGAPTPERRPRHDPWRRAK